MTAARTVVFDNEAVQALADPHHPKHRRALAYAELAAAGSRNTGSSVRLVVPTAVRVEACWDRRAPRAASINRLNVSDLALDASSANVAARIRTNLRVSVADAHIAAVLASCPAPRTVVTSDVDDVRAIARHLDAAVTVVRI